ncbi:MAG TPA: hypothetical protein VJK02_25640 [Anaerolineales bacterium]|nr:hypothetical protein [Anaerolineales bacterium]
MPKSTELRNAMTVLLAVSMLAGPLALGPTVFVHRASAATPFQTLAPQDPSLPTAVGDVGPLPTAIPTLYPGQSFEEADAGRPTVDQTAMEGDLQFGFQRLAENPDLYMVWMTDEARTHYMIVRADSDVLTGGLDPESGFLFLVRERDRVHGEILTTVTNRDTYKSSARDFRWGAVGSLVVAGILAFVAPPAAVVFIGIAGGAFWAGRGQDTNAEIQQNTLEALQRQLVDYQGDLRQGFLIGQAMESTP